VKTAFSRVTVILVIALSVGFLLISAAYSESPSPLPSPYVTVFIDPAEAALDGAQWLVDYHVDPSPGPSPSPSPDPDWPSGWLDSGVSYPLKTGSFIITFKEIQGWDPAEDMEIVVTSSGDLFERTGAYTPWYGDVDRNETVNVGDAIYILRHIVSLIDLNDHYGYGTLLRAKVCLDENPVNVGDAIYVLRYIVGLITEFPVEQ
jgi:hypothetical protein